MLGRAGHRPGAHGLISGDLALLVLHPYIDLLLASEDRLQAQVQAERHTVARSGSRGPGALECALAILQSAGGPRRDLVPGVPTVRGQREGAAGRVIVDPAGAGS